MWVRSCLFKLLLSLNDLSHLEQANGFSPVWVRSCPFKLLLTLNNLSDLEQANAFSPAWVRSCLFKLLLSINFLSHLEQANGFSPVWVRSCLFKLLLSLHDLSHLEQANGFSPVWVHSCPFKLLLPLNNFSRLEQANASRWSRWPSYGWPRPQCDPRWSGVGAKWSSTLCYHHILWKLALKCTPGAKDVPYGKVMAGRHRPPRGLRLTFSLLADKEAKCHATY